MLACPDCATARLVRASVLDERFWTNVAALALPLLLLAVIASLLHRAGARPGSRNGKGESNE